MITLLSERTASGTSDPVGVTGDALPLVFHAAPPLEAGETAHVEFFGGDRAWHDLWIDGFRTQLDSTRRMQPVFVPGRFRVVKETTGRSTGIYATTESND